MARDEEQYSEQYPEVWETNLKAIVDKLQQQLAHGGDVSQQQGSVLFGANQAQGSVLFENLVSQQAQLFNQALQAQAKLTDLSVQYMARVAHDGQSVSVKELDPDVSEVAESAIMADIVARLEEIEAKVKSG